MKLPFIPFPLPPALARLHERLERYTEEREEGFFLAEQDKNRQAGAQPVLIFVTGEAMRAPPGPEKLPPSWIGEVLTPSSDRDARRSRYATARVGEYWQLEPDATPPRIEVCTDPRDGDYTQRAVFEGADPVVSGVFRELVLAARDLVP